MSSAFLGWPSLRRAGVVASLLICGVGSVAHAQGGGPSQRPFRGLFGGGGPRDPQAARTTVGLFLGVSGSYDEHLAPQGIGGGPSADPSSAPAGSIAAFDATLEFARVRDRTTISLALNGATSRYDADPVTTTTGGGLSARLSRAYGRDGRNSIYATQGLRYDPVYTGNGQSLFRPIGFEGTSNIEPSGLYFRDSWSSDSAIGLATQLSLRDRVTIGYGYSMRDYPDEVGGDIRQHNVSASYGRQISRSLSLQTDYQVTKADYDLNARFSLPLHQHFITVGPQYVKRLSPTRRLTLGGGFGGNYVKERNQLTSEEFSTWSPAGQANVGIDLARSWRLGGNYARSVTLLEGLTRQRLLLDSASMTLTGLPHERVELASSFNFSIQASDLGETTADSDYRTKTFSTRGRIALSRLLALQLTYQYYDYDFGAAADLLEGIPRQFSRNVGTIGLTVWLPLYGQTVGEPRP